MSSASDRFFRFSEVTLVSATPPAEAADHRPPDLVSDPEAAEILAKFRPLSDRLREALTRFADEYEKNRQYLRELSESMVEGRLLALAWAERARRVLDRDAEDRSGLAKLAAGRKILYDRKVQKLQGERIQQSRILTEISRTLDDLEQKLERFERLERSILLAKGLVAVKKEITEIFTNLDEKTGLPLERHLDKVRTTASGELGFYDTLLELEDRNSLDPAEMASLESEVQEELKRLRAPGGSTALPPP